MSILRIAKEKGAPGKTIKAKESRPFRIYKKNFAKGDVNVPIILPLKDPQTQIVLFFETDSTAPKALSCGGAEEMISIPTSDAYQSCEASSEFANGQYKCEYGLSNKMEDTPQAIWITDGEGVSSWIKVNFNSKYQITRFELKNREDPSQRNKQYTVNFDDGSS